MRPRTRADAARRSPQRDAPPPAPRTLAAPTCPPFARPPAGPRGRATRGATAAGTGVTNRPPARRRTGTRGASGATAGHATTSDHDSATTATARTTFPQRTRSRSPRSMAPIAARRRRRFAPALLASSAAMATEAPLYDLTLLLDTEMESERRDQILANVEHAIEGSRRDRRPSRVGHASTAYEVRKHAEADYHLLQFRGPRELLEQLDHNLKITDGILRHRIIKLRPGTPASAGPQRRRHAASRPPASPRGVRARRARARLRSSTQQQNSPICGAVAGFPRSRT